MSALPFFPHELNRRKQFKLIAAADALRLTGLDIEELVAETDTQRLSQVNKDGSIEEFLRVPIDALLGENPAANDEG